MTDELNRYEVTNPETGFVYVAEAETEAKAAETVAENLHEDASVTTRELEVVDTRELK